MTVLVVPDDHATIQGALDLSGASDEVWVRSNTYAEGDLQKLSTGIVLRGHPDNLTKPVINASGFTNGVLFYTDWIVKELEIRSSDSWGMTGLGSDRVAYISDMYLLQTGYWTSAGGGIKALKAGSTVDSVHVHLPGAQGIYGASATVTNCLVTYPRLTGIALTAAASRAYYCTVYGSSSHGITVAAGQARGCVVSQSTLDSFHATTGTTYDSTSYSPGGSDFTGANTDCQVDDPLFVAAGTDYHLQAASPCIDYVSTDVGVYVDLDGVARPQGAAYDAGAYEYVSPDCGISDVDQVDSLSATVTFAASPAGTQVPLEASAETASNWGVASSPADAALVVVKASMVSSLVYTVEYNHRTTPGATITVDSSAIDTDDGGLCDDPGTGTYTATSDAESPTADAIEWPLEYAASVVGEVLSDSDLHAGLLIGNVTPKLAQIVLNLLLSDRSAQLGDVLPSTGKPATVADDRGGWWADPTFGSRLWLLKRPKLGDDTLARSVTYADEALAVLVTNGILGSVASSSDYVTDRRGKRIGLALTIDVTQPDGSTGSIRYDDLWQQLGGAA